MISGSQLGFGLDGFSNEYHNNAKARTSLFQYTNFNSFLHIIMDKTLLFNRIDKMNDVQEAELFKNEEVARLVYVSCFTTQKAESIPMWNIYTQKDDGIRLEFETEQGCIKDAILDKTREMVSTDGGTIGLIGKTGNFDISKWYIDLSQTDICYMNTEKIADTFIKVGNIYDLNKMALVKDEAWKYEKESRLVIKLRTTEENIEVPNINGVLMPISLCNLKKLEVVFSPWMDGSQKQCIKDISKQYLTGVNIQFKDSKFTRKIIRK